jgi:uncharacterized protein DUF2721
MINPFAALSAIAGPAILTNACSVLALGTSNRLGRVVDRTRVLFREIDALEPERSERIARQQLIAALDVRAHLLLKALRLFYASLGLFATAALMSALGSVFAIYRIDYGFDVAALIALASGVAAVAGLSLGCIVMIRETRLAVQHLEHEATVRFNSGRNP